MSKSKKKPGKPPLDAGQSGHIKKQVGSAEIVTGPKKKFLVEQIDEGKERSRIQARIAVKKAAMLQALEETLGIVKAACMKAGVSRSTHYEWMNEDKAYKKACHLVIDDQVDFAESELLKNIKTGDVASIIFFLKCKGKDRGYVERQEIEHDASVNKRISLIIKADEEV